MSKIKLTGDSSGYVEISAGDNAGNNTLELPTSGTKIVASDSNNNVDNLGIVTATSFAGGLTGNVTGNVTGNLTGNVTGNIISSGVSTFSSGLHVTGGSVGIGTDNPSSILDVRSSASDSGIYLGRPGLSPNFFVYNNGGQNSSRMILRHEGSNVIEFRADGAGSYIKSGNVGIGTDNPTAEFEVLGAGTVASFRGTGGSSFIQIKDEDDGTLGFIGVDGGNIKLQTSGSSYADKLVVDTAGRVTMPYQPAFVAYLSSNFSYTGSGARLLVPFDSTATNIGGHFNTTNRRFVAPVAGTYIFTASLVCNGGSSSAYFSCDIWVNGSYVPGSNGWQNMSGGYQIQRSSLITYLAVNDYVDVRMEKSANDTINGNNNYSAFTGALLG